MFNSLFCGCFSVGPPLLIPVFFQFQIFHNMISHGLWVVGYSDRFDSRRVYAAECEFTALSLPLSYLFQDLLCCISYYVRYLLCYTQFYGVFWAVILFNFIRYTKIISSTTSALNKFIFNVIFQMHSHWLRSKLHHVIPWYYVFFAHVPCSTMLFLHLPKMILSIPGHVSQQYHSIAENTLVYMNIIVQYYDMSYHYGFTFTHCFVQSQGERERDSLSDCSSLRPLLLHQSEHRSTDCSQLLVCKRVIMLQRISV